MTQIDPIYDKQCTCKICNNAFTTKKLRSKFIKVKSYDTDFCPIYSSEELNPILYNVNVCPHCGFSSTDDCAPYFPPGAIDEIQEKVCAQWALHDYGEKRTIQDAIKTYKLAVYCCLLKKEKHIIVAGFYVRLAWLYRILENVEQEQRFMNLAMNDYLNSYMADDFKGTQMSEVKILYLIGELARRTHKRDQAVKYFSKVIEQQNRSVESGIIDMARERWHDIRADKHTENVTTT
ncbi:uncharacterized protein (DUF2225 family) [Cytobacillus eiseniae]|uniref:Uncharacterized protein (DUF2225 family) n=1 Tax=Cytobacillus eiseniae TaxID=762947 RepID=A0ABS4RC33_9BACI|nr:DUF2225 domain-containing protein [Cytobacillus eiseniae]MBP2240455.1 uncharacterized protein (DUF2225 family) [Cytobacillus eiseniae]